MSKKLNQELVDTEEEEFIENEQVFKIKLHPTHFKKTTRGEKNESVTFLHLLFKHMRD